MVSIVVTVVHFRTIQYHWLPHTGTINIELNFALVYSNQPEPVLMDDYVFNYTIYTFDKDISLWDYITTGELFEKYLYE